MAHRKLGWRACAERILERCPNRITVLFQYGAVGCDGRNRMRQNVMQTGRNDEDRLASFAADCGARQAMDASGLCRALARLATFSQVLGD